jgi:hypothetical protein
MSELSPEARTALGELREDLPDDQARARMRARLLAAGALAASTTLASSTAQAATVGSKLSAATVGASGLGASVMALPIKVALVVASLTAVGVGVGVGVATLPSVARPRAQQAPSPAIAADSRQGGRPVPADGPLSPSIAPLLPEFQAAPAVSPALRVRKSLPRLAPAPSAAPSLDAAPAPAAADESSLQLESVLLLRALEALNTGDPCAAQERLDEYARKFGASAALGSEHTRLRARLNTALRDQAFGPLTCSPKEGTLP